MVVGDAVAAAGVLKVFAQDTGGYAGGGLFIVDPINQEQGFMLTGFSLEGVSVDTSGNPTGWASLCVNRYSTGDVALAGGGGRVVIGLFSTTSLICAADVGSGTGGHALYVRGGDGNGSNKSGGTLYISGGRSTGTSTSSSIQMQTAPAGGTVTDSGGDDS